MGKLLRRLEAKAYGAIAAEQEAEREVDKLRLSSTGNRSQRRSVDGKLVHARRRCILVLEQHDTLAKAVELAREGMEVVNLETGMLRTAEEMKQMLISAADLMKGMSDDKCRKVGRYLANRAPGLVLYVKTFTEALHALTEQHGDEPVRLASIVLRLRVQLQSRVFQWRRFEDRRHLLGAYAMLMNRAADDYTKVATVLLSVQDILWRRHRASSAVEGFNATLRPHLYVHKNATQGFLELFRAYYNLRRRRWGRHKRTTPYEVMTGRKVGDWLTLLGCPPSSTPVEVQAA